MPALALAPRLRRSPRALALGGLVAALVSIAAPGYALWVPQGTQLTPLSGDQLVPATLADGAGGMFVAWSDGRGTSMDIYMQRLDASGNPLWTANGVTVCAANGTQNNIQLIADGAGGVIAAWFDYRSAAGLYTQRLDGNGTALWRANGVQVAALSCLQSYSMCSDGASGALFAFERCNTVTLVDIAAQRVNSAGTVRWGATGLSVCQASNNQTSPGIALCDDGSGNSVISWADDREGTQIGYSIYAQKVSAAGTALWVGGGIPVSLYVAASDHWPLRVLGDGADGAVLTWYDNGISTYKVWSQHINGSGQGQWQNGGIRVCTANGPQYYPVACKDGAGGTIVLWYDQRNDLLGDLYAQRISSTGTLQWATDGVPVCTSPKEQFQYSIGSDGNGGAFMVWQDARADTANDIYAQHLDGTGAWQWGDANGIAIGQAPLYQVMASAVPDGQGGILAAWEDYRSNTDYDIYVARAPNQAVAIGEPPATDAAPALRVEPALLRGPAPSASIALSGVKAERADVVISDVSGRVVSRTTVTPSPSGDVRAQWDGTGANGRAVSSGVYAVSLRAGSRTWRHSLVVVR